MRQLKDKRTFKGQIYHRKLNTYYDSPNDARFDAGIYRSIGYRIQITKAKDGDEDWWFIWLNPDLATIRLV